MELTTENGSVLRAPSAEQLRATLDTLGPDNGYAILAQSEQVYMQVSGDRFDGYSVEYREGSEESHHLSVDGGLTHTQMQNVMAAYLQRGAWKTLIAWQPGMGRGIKNTRASSSSRQKAATGAFPLLFLIPFLLVGLGAAGAMVYLGVDSYRFRQRAVSVPGTVTALVGHDTQTAIVVYTDPSGEPGELKSQWASSPPAFDVGERVQVLHDASEPDPRKRARIDSFGEMWGTALFSSIFALTFGGVAIGVLIATLRGRRRRAA